MNARLAHGRTMRRAVLAGNWLLGAAALCAFALVALVHLADNHHVDHVSGAWMGLAAYAADGTLYPPLQADGAFGGTRYMPLGIGVNAAAAALSGEQLVSGKVVALLTMAGLLAVVYVLARRLGCERAVALGTVGAVIATFVAMFAGTTIYGDVLAAALQLAAVATVAGETSRRAAIAAGVLAALAFTAKLSALWGAGTVLVWLLARDRRHAPAFAAAALATAIVALAAAEVVSSGRLHENVVALAGGGLESAGHLLVDTPRKIWQHARADAPGTIVLAPCALLAVGLAAARRRLEIVDVALVLAALVTLFVMTDVGSGFNHLLDLAVLVPLAVAGYIGRTRDGALRTAFAAALVLAIVVSLVDVRSEVRVAATALLERSTPEALRTPALRQPIAGPVLSEDPTIPVQRGQRPVVLDGFMLLRILREHPAWRRELVGRIARQEFGTIVLITDLDLDDPWWSKSHFGIDVARAIDESYEFDRRTPGPTFAYRLYVPAR